MFVQVHPQVVVIPTLNCAIHTGTGKLLTSGDEYARVRTVLDSLDTILLATDIPLLENKFLVLAHDLPHVNDLVRSEINTLLTSVGALAVMPTERCNFRCTYCYETFEKGRMRPEIVAAIKSFLVREFEHLPMYNLSWFGGEPLLAFDIIDDLSTEFRRLQKLHGTRGSLSITTNGSLLNRPMVDRLSELDLNLAHISVDGPKELHNRQRRSLNGQDSYEQILNGIEMLLELTQCNILFRVNVETRYEASGRIISNWLAESIVPRFSRFSSRIQYHAVSIWDASTKAVDGICLDDIGRFQTLWHIRESIAAASGMSMAELLRLDMQSVGSMACYAGRPHHYVAGSDGSIYKCTVAFDLDANRIGAFQSDGSVRFDKDKENIWIGANVLTDTSCAGCRFGSSCLGLHCPLTRMQTSKPPCPSVKRHLNILKG